MVEKKESKLKKLDSIAEQKGGFAKTLWQFVKFSIASLIATLIQLVLSNVLPFLFDKVMVTIPSFLQGIFDPSILFDTTTQAGLQSFEKYVVGGVVTWGFVLPFFISNFVGNIYAYIQNKKTTFNSDAPTYCFVIYFVVLIILILVATWVQGLIYGWMNSVDSAFINSVSRTVAMFLAGMIQFIVLFPLEKFVLLKEKKED